MFIIYFAAHFGAASSHGQINKFILTLYQMKRQPQWVAFFISYYKCNSFLYCCL